MKKMIVAGNIGKDAEIRQKANSKEKFITMSVAVNEDYKDKKTGEKIKRTDWISCILNYERYQNLAPYLKSGAFCTISGKPAINLYKDDKGEHHANFRLIVNELTLFSPKEKVLDKETGEIIEN